MLANTMEQNGKTRNAKNVRDSGALVLLGVEFRNLPEEWINLKAKLIDLVIAVGSAVKVAGELNMDNRIMHSDDEAAKKIGLLKADEILGTPLTVKGEKNFFDHKTTS
jgi:uncharacterized ferredoxin-like protein